MKKYIAPELAVSLFDSESIVTLSDPGKTSAFDTARSVFDGTSGSVDIMSGMPKVDVAHTFVVDLGE